MASFDCKSINRSIDHIRLFCKEVDIIALQETWFLKHDLEFANKIVDSFASFSKSCVDSLKGILRGWPYGGLTMWRKSLFESDVVVSVVECNSNRLAAIKLSFHNRQILFINVYRPVDIEDNLTELTNTLSNMSAIIDECGVEAVLMVGDYNAHSTARFGSEMSAYCAEQTWNCTDIDILGINSKTFTFLSEAHGTVKWLDHCLATSAARKIFLM
ncbi:unnamed protein product [Parnassius apollo]|uniref:(apollo) hypothetical protein n=1 Tax=Parnassius apollo TaxID=110799 RepID=A0A8S3XQS6_PARAO|nr:unnamed protein product [Parnassius apollo]